MRHSKAEASFKRAVLETPEVASSMRNGLQALTGVDRKRIAYTNSRIIVGSISFDDALASKYPNAPLWDYGVGLSRPRGSDQIKWIEVHSAASTHVNELLKKLQWLRTWLRESAGKLDALPREFVWIASGKVHLQQGSPQIRKIAQAGLRFVGTKLILDI